MFKNYSGWVNCYKAVRVAQYVSLSACAAYIPFDVFLIPFVAAQDPRACQVVAQLLEQDQVPRSVCRLKNDWSPVRLYWQGQRLQLV